MLLKDFVKKTGFIVVQTRGVEGYDLALPQYSTEMKASIEDEVKVYEFVLKRTIIQNPQRFRSKNANVRK